MKGQPWLETATTRTCPIWSAKSSSKWTTSSKPSTPVARSSKGPVQDDDREASGAWELDEEGGSDKEADEESIGDEEADDASELQFDRGDRNQEYVERFLEIASRQFESEAEVDQAMNETLDDMAREYLFGSIWNKAKKLGSKLASNPALRALAKKGLKVASGQLPALKAALQLAKGDLKGSLLNLGKQALGAAIPGGPAVLGALGSLGFWKSTTRRQTGRPGTTTCRCPGRRSSTWRTTSRRLRTSRSRRVGWRRTRYRHAMRRAQSRVSGRRRQPGGVVVTAGRSRGPVVRHHLQPGQKIVITGAAKLIVKGV